MKSRVRQSARALCLILLCALLLPLSACSYASDPAATEQEKEAFAFGEEYPDEPDGPGAAAVYLQVSGVGSFTRDGAPLFPEGAQDVLDMIYLAFARFDGEGVSLPAVPAEVRALREKGVKVLVSFSANAGDSSRRLSEIADDPERAAAFAQMLTGAVRAADLDGIDLDWEATPGGAHPTPDGMNTLAAALRDAGEGMLLTCAVPASPWGLGEDRFDLETLASLVDYFNLMSYDLGKNDRATHTAPLYPSQTDDGWGLGAVTGLSLLTEKGVSPAKVLIGCVGYGRSFLCTDGEEARPGADARPTRLDLAEGAYQGVVQGRGLEALLNDPAWTEVNEERDGAFVGSYLVRDDLFVTFDSHRALTEKLAFARRTGCGVMLWSWTQDTGFRFFRALREALPSDGT